MDSLLPHADRGGPAQPLLVATGLRKHFPVPGGLLGRSGKVVCAFRRSRPLIPVDRDHLFRSIATSVARVLLAPLDVAVDVSLPRAGQARQKAVPVVNRRDPRATRSALTADAAARAGGPC